MEHDSLVKTITNLSQLRQEFKKFELTYLCNISMMEPLSVNTNMEQNLIEDEANIDKSSFANEFNENDDKTNTE